MSSSNPSPAVGRSPFARQARYCRECGKHLADEGPGECPACGAPYDPSLPETYRTAPMFLGWRFWFPGFFLAVVSGVVSYAVVLKTGQEMGVALFVSVPASFGAILGYATRVRIWVAMALGLVAIACVGISLVAMNLAGFFCGLTLGAVFLGPVMSGIFLGWLLRVVLKLTPWSQRWYLPLIFFLLTPFASEVIEGRLPHETVVATVQTELTIHATPQEAWDSLQFYEQVEHQPPFLARWLLPRPLRAEGSRAAVGDKVRCVYSKGYVVKQITRLEPGRLLAFDVTEQTLFSHDVTLLDGSFEFVPVDAEHTRVVLSTRYQRRLSPAAEWQPIERAVIHSLHGHVLEGMRRRAEHELPYEPGHDTRPAGVPVTRAGP